MLFIHLNDDAALVLLTTQFYSKKDIYGTLTRRKEPLHLNQEAKQNKKTFSCLLFPVRTSVFVCVYVCDVLVAKKKEIKLKNNSYLFPFVQCTFP